MKKCKVFCILLVTLLTAVSCSGKSVGAYDMYRDVTRIDDNYRNYYEIFVGAFSDSDGDGMGDLNGVINKLDYLNDGNDDTMDDLGVTGIWLMPICTSPTYHKYDVQDYYTVDPAYGTNDDFKRLADECRKRGIKLIVDLVLNHSSSQNPWFVSASEAAVKGTDSPYKDFYNFSDVWQSGWTEIGSSGVYYESKFDRGMPDLNMDSSALREEVVKISKFWLELGADGFRLDAAMWVYEDAVKDEAFWQWFQTEIRKINPSAYTVGEVYAGDSAIKEYYKSQLDSLFAFGLSSVDGYIASTINRASYTGLGWSDYNARMTAALAEANPQGIYAPFLTNHDQGRSYGILRSDPIRAKMAASLYLTLPGNPFIYYGEELGMVSSGTKDENKRTAFKWGDASVTCRDPVNADTFEQPCASVADQLKDKNSLLSHYRHVLRIRDENPELARGVMKAIDLKDDSLAAYSVTYNGSTVYVIHNLAKGEGGEKTISSDKISGALRGYITIKGTAPTVKDGTVTLPEYATVILK